MTQLESGDDYTREPSKKDLRLVKVYIDYSRSMVEQR
jgi:hypothetical protein